MGSATVGTIVITGVIVAVLAIFLITIGLRLQRLSFTLGTIVVGLRSIREQTRPVGGVLGSIVGDVTAIEDALGGVLAAVGGGAPAPQAESMSDAVARARGDEVEVVEVVEVIEYEDDGLVDEDEDEDEGEGYEDENEYEEYDKEEEEDVPALFEVPTRSRRGGSGMQEAVAKARERMAVRR